MTDSFKSTAATNIYDQAVNTYFNPVSVLPETGIMGIARALKNNNPDLQRYLGNVIEEEKQKGILQGELEVLMANPERLKEITDALKTQDKSVAKNVLSKNLFVRAGIEKRLAINHGLSQEGKLTNYLNNKLIEVEGDDGSVRQVPLKEFDVNSDEFKTSINDFNAENRADLKGIRPEFVNNYFMPEAAKAVSKAYVNQEKNNQEFISNLQNSSFTDTVLANFSTIDFNKLDDIDVTNPESKLNLAIKAINEEVTLLDSLGATSTVSPTGMTKNALHLAEVIFDINLKKNKSGVVAVRNFKNLIGQVKVGPKITLEDGTVIQDTLMKYLGEDWNKMMSRMITAENNYDTFKEKKINKIIKPQIEAALKDFEFTTEGPSGETIRNTEALNKLAVIFKDTPDVFLDVIEDLDISRDEFYDDFATKIINKNFASPLQAINELRKFEASLGKTITDEDTTELNELKDMITTHLGKDRLAIYRPRIKELIEDSKDLLGGNNQVSPWRKRTGVQLYFSDATQFLNKEIIRISKEAKTPEEFAEGIEEAMKNYRKDILRLNNNKTLKTYKLKESGLWFEAQEELGIDLKDEGENAPPIKVSQEEFNKLLEKGRIEEDSDGNFNRVDDGRRVDIIPDNTGGENKNGGFKGWIKNLFTDDVSMNTTDGGVIPVSNKIQAGEGGTEVPTEGGEDMSRPEGGVLQNNLKLTLNKFDQFKGAVSYGSGGRGSNLEKDKNYITTIEKDGFSHAYADKSSKQVIDKAKEIYTDLVMNNTKENIEAKYAIAQMVLTEAILSSEDDIFGVMQSVLMRVARARLGVREYPYGVYSTDIITEMLRPYQYVGLKDAGVTTKEQLLEKAPIKENEETLKRVIDILWNIDPTGSKVII
ncbi:hypothetical protein PSCSP2_00029 [Prochlorococcus phage P-SCSP2]|nr:hypothetical protein PSCSP2_00029 [Prochlorococcus phage P-SCSP2]